MKNLSFRKGILEKKYTNSIIKEVFRKSIHLCSSFIPLFVDKIYSWIEKNIPNRRIPDEKH
jgi:hypothetical protein